MKALLIGALFASASAFALQQTHVATCIASVESTGTSAGAVDLYTSDNGDEGFMDVVYTPYGDKSQGMTFTDNTQDDGAEFLTPGKDVLYVPIEGIKPNNSRTIHGAALYLKNSPNQGKISGLLKIDFDKYTVVCKKLVK